mgnify:CR=1 FL=1
MSCGLSIVRNACICITQCKVGYAGNGLECDVDTDVDGIPDSDLPCDEKSCKQV